MVIVKHLNPVELNTEVHIIVLLVVKIECTDSPHYRADYKPIFDTIKEQLTKLHTCSHMSSSVMKDFNHTANSISYW